MERFHDKLKIKMDQFAHLMYSATKRFPRDELYGITSQLRRAALSVVLNYVEGYARIKTRVYINFLETAYGSLVESDYLLDFAYREGYMIEKDHHEGKILTKEIGAMLWTTIDGLKKKQ